MKHAQRVLVVILEHRCVSMALNIAQIVCIHSKDFVDCLVLCRVFQPVCLLVFHLAPEMRNVLRDGVFGRDGENGLRFLNHVSLLV